MKTNILRFATLFTVLLTCFAAKPEKPGAATTSTGWTLYSLTKSARYNPSSAAGIGGDVATFTFPTATANAAYAAILTTIVPATNLTGRTITSDVNISSTGNPVFVSRSSGGGLPANVRLFISSYGGAYNLNYANSHPWEFFWSNPVNLTVTGTLSGSMVVPLDAGSWSSANGMPATANVAAFNLAIASITQYGVSFGKNSYFDNGLAIVSGTGSAQFHVTAYGW